ncbi:unnamed protein product [Peniophora sp. CBMAI 1063]|nr:unnamed protein product [Peniophora sp. CBMAI 1063]
MPSERAALGYEKDMRLRKRGHALFNPHPGYHQDPVSRALNLNPAVEIGDVGLILNGSFHLLFNIHRAKDDPHQIKGTPDNFVPLERGDIWVYPRKIAREFVENRHGVSANFSVDVSVPGFGGGSSKLSYTHDQGATLNYFDLHEESYAVNLDAYEKYYREHLADWLRFLKARGYKQTAHDIVLVTGYERARAWATTWSESSSGGAELSLQVQPPIPIGFDAGVSLTASLSWNHTSSVDALSGPTELSLPLSLGDSTSSPSLTEQESPSSSLLTTSSSDSTGRVMKPYYGDSIQPSSAERHFESPTSPSADQCLFIKGFRAWVVFRKDKVLRLRGGANSRSSSPSDRVDDESQLVLMDTSGFDSDGALRIDEISDAAPAEDTSLLAFALKTVAELYEPTCEDDILLMHDDELNPFLPDPDNVDTKWETLADAHSYVTSRLQLSPPQTLRMIEGSGWVQSHEDTTNSPPLHALIIGIDRYRSHLIENLTGAVNDADAIHNFLRTELRVPDRQIVNLRNERATRAAIIRNVRAFSRPENGIRKGDPILIYFAGYGSSAAAPTEWRTNGRDISLIVPHDGLLGDDVLFTNAIPIRSVHALLQELTSSIGDNITVIMDCSHSVPDTANGLARRARCIRSGRVHAELDNDIWSDIALQDELRASSKFDHPSAVDSHVLLAACRDTEVAYESNGRGFFTSKLIAALQTHSVEHTTYDSLMQNLADIPGQSPFCLGDHSGRILFDAHVAHDRRAMYRVDISGSIGIVVVWAGSLHGVTPNTEFSVYTSRGLPGPSDGPVAVVTAKEVGPFSTETSGSLSLATQPCFAIPNTTAAVDAIRIHFSSTDAAAQSIKSALAYAHELPWHWGEPGMIVEGNEKVLRDTISIGMHELVEDEEALLDDELNAPYVVRDSRDLHQRGFADVVADDQTYYGMVVRNNSDDPLYLWAFYFDCSDLSIIDYYQRMQTARGIEPSIPPRGQLTIGYGAGGGAPFSYFLRPDQDLDIGFIKLIVSRQPIDLSDFRQESPFHSHAPYERVPDEIEGCTRGKFLDAIWRETCYTSAALSKRVPQRYAIAQATVRGTMTRMRMYGDKDPRQSISE